MSAGAPQDWRKERLHSWRTCTRFHNLPGQSNDSIGAWARPPCGSWRVSWGGRGWLWLTVGQGHWWWRSKGISISVSSPRGHHFGTETWPHLTACRLKCWDTSGQTTNRVGTQPHPLADRLPKVILSAQMPLNIPLDTALPTRRTRPSSTHQWAGTSPSHHKACTGPWTNLTHQGADTRSKKNYKPAA